jgi:hypothetical protein
MPRLSPCAQNDLLQAVEQTRDKLNPAALHISTTACSVASPILDPINPITTLALDLSK